MSSSASIVAEQIAIAIIKAIENNPEVAKDVAAMTAVVQNLEKAFAPQLIEEVSQFAVGEAKECVRCFSGMCMKKKGVKQ